MAVSISKLRTAYHQSQIDLSKNFEEKIDKQLSKEYDYELGTRFSYLVPEKLDVSTVKLLARKYEHAGWDATVVVEAEDYILLFLEDPENSSGEVNEVYF